MKTSGQPSPFRLCLLIVMFLSYSDAYVFGAPRGAQVVSGTASFTQNGNLTVITAGNRSIINYTGFDIGKNETVQFIQPGAGATVLNRVTTADPTNIFGHLESNGIVIIANPYGVFFQNGSVVSVGGLIAGAGKISDADFTAGNIHFTDLTGDVRNDGVIAADNQIALMGANVVNTGSLAAAHGMAMMVSGPDVYVGDKNGNIFVQANGKSLKAAATAGGASAASAGSVTNSGTVAAPRVLLGAGDMYSTAIVNSGLLQGRSVAVNAGARGSATISGKVDATSASNPTATGTGGSIDVLGGTVALKGATLDASGSAGGGTVRVGGDFHGAPTLAASATTTVDAASAIRADATGSTGDGGTVVLWSGNSTSFGGTISARGGAAGGNGGAVEVSSHGALGYQGLVDAGAPAGKVGSLLLDPSNIDIVAGAPVGDGTLPTGPVNTPPGTFTVSQGALEGTTGAITLTASNDIRIEPLTSALGTTLAFSGTGAVTFTAGANTSTGAASTGSFVMARLSDSISNPGQPLTINANGASPAGGGNLNDGNGAAIEVGNLSTANTAVTGTNGGNVSLNVSGAATAPVRVGSITTASSNGNAGSITIGGATFAGNITTETGTGYAGTLTASSSGANGVGTAAGTGGAVTLNTSGAVTLAGAVTTTSAGAGAGSITIGTTGASAVPASITTSDVLNAAATGGTTTLVGTGGAVTLNSTGAISLGGDVTTSSASAGAGNITIGAVASPVFPTSITTAAGDRLTATATGAGAGLTGAGGKIILDAAGGITLGGAASTASSGAAGGPIGITATGAVSTGNLTASSAVSSATAVGSVVVGANGMLTVNNLDASSASGPGGAITLGPPTGLSTVLPTGLTVNGTIKTGGSTATTGGPITLETSGGLTLPTMAPSFTGNTTLVANTTNATSYTTNGYNFSLDLTGAAINASEVTDTPNNLTLASTTGINIDEATVTSAGNQTYLGPVTLTAAGSSVALRAGTTTATGAINFSTTLDDNASGAHALTLTPGSSGSTTFGGAVGTTPLASLTATTGTTGATNSTVPVFIDGAGIKTTGAQSYGTITLNGTPATSAVTLTGTGISSGTVTGNSHPLTVTDGGTATFAAINSGAAVAFNGTGATVLNGTIVAGSLSVTGGTGVTLNAGNAVTNTVTTSAGQSYEKLTLGANTTLGDTGAGNITFNGTVDATGAGAQALTVGTDGTTTFQGAVGSSQPLSGLATQGISTGTAGTTFFDVTGGGTTVATQANTGSGVQYYSNAVVLGAGTTLQSTFTGAATVGGPVTFGSTVSSSTAGGATTSENLTVTTTGLTTFGGQVGGPSLTATVAPALDGLDVTNAAQINATTVTTIGPQIYGSLTLGGTGTTTLASTSGQSDVSVGTVTGGSNGLTVAINPASVNVSSFGAITTTGALNFTLATSTNFTGAINAGSVNFQTSVTDGAFYFSGGTVATTGGQTYGGANGVIALSAPLTLSDSNKGNISLPLVTSVGASNALTINTGGTTTFNNTVGTLGGSTLNLASVQVGLAGGANLGGTVQFSGNSITTNGAAGQVYNDKALLAATTTLNAGSGPVTFAQSLGSEATPEALTIGTTGTTTFGGAVGGTAAGGATVMAAPALASLNLTGSGPVALNGGSVTTVTTPGGTQNYGTGAVTLGATTVITGYSATFGGGITEATAGTYGLTLNLASQVTLPGTGLLTNLGDFTSEGTGGVLINNSISTYGSQTYSGGAVTIATGAPTNLTLTAGTGNAAGSITISSALNDQSPGTHNLTLTTGSAGMVTLGGPIGAMGALLSLTSTAQPTRISGGSVTTVGSQSYGPLTLGAATTLTSTGAGTVSAGTVTGAGNVFNVSAIGTGGTSTFAAINDAGGAVNFEVAGIATFNGAITASSFGLGTSTAGTRGVFNAGGTTVSTTLGQTYGEEIYLGAGTTLADTMGGAISLQGVDSATATAETLAVNTSGATIFGGAVGATNALASVTTDAPGSTQLNGGGIKTTGAQTFNDPVTLGAGTVLNAGSGAVTFAQTLGSAATPEALTINTTGTTTFDGAVGGSTIIPGANVGTFVTAPALYSLSVSGPTVISGGSVTTITTAPTGTTPTSGSQTYGGQVTLGATTTLQGYSATFGNGITETTPGTYSLTLNFAGQVTLPGTNLLTNVGNFTSEGGGGVLINNSISTYGSQTYSGGAVTIATGAPTNLTLTAGTGNAAGSITISAPLDEQATAGLHNLTLVAGSAGMVTLGAPVGASLPLLSLTSTGQGTKISGGSVTTTGSQNYGPLTLGAATTLTSTATTGAVGINSGAVTGNSDALNINVASANGSSNIGPITMAGTLTLSMGGTSTFGTISDAAPVNYTGGTVNFGGLGATNVSVGATGAANFNGTVAATGSFLSNGTGTTAFNDPVTANSLTVKNGTSATLNAGTIVTVNGQTYSEPALVASTASLTDGAMISLLKVDSATATPEGLTVSAPLTLFGGAVGTTHPLASLTTNGITAQINGGSVATTGTQLYNTVVTLGAPTVLTAGALTFAQTLGSAGSPQTLLINTAGTTTFDGQVGGAPGAAESAVVNAPALASLAVDGGGPVDINGGGVTTVTTAGGSQTYTGQVTLSATAELKGNSLSLASAGLAGGGFNLTLDFVQQVTVPSAITGVGTFMTVGAGGALINGAFTTTGSQTYSGGNVTLAGAPVLTSTAGSLIFYTPVDGNAPLTLNATGAGGQVVFNTGAQVGNTTTLGAFTSNTAAGTLFGMNATARGGVNAASVMTTGPVAFNEAGATGAQPDILTTGAQTYDTGAVTLDGNTFLTSTGTITTGAISFGTSAATAATIDSAAATTHSLTLNTPGTQTFYGLIGSTTALGGLTTGPGPTVFDMTIPTTNPAVVAAGVRVNGAVTTTGPVTFNVAGSNPMQPSVLTLGSGAQTYGTLTNPVGTAVTLQGAVTVLNSANTEPTPGTFSGGGTITFNGNIVSTGGTQELDVFAGEGTTVFGGPITTTGNFVPGGASVVFNGSVGPLGTFTVQPNTNTGAGIIDLNGGSFTAGGFMNFTLPTVLSANTTLTAGSNISFVALDGGNVAFNTPHTLTINLTGGNVNFAGLVGNSVPLASLEILNTGGVVGTTTFSMALSGAGAGNGGVNVLGVSGSPAVRIDNNVNFEAVGVAGGATPTILTGVTYNGQVGTGQQVYNGAVTVGATANLLQNTVLRDEAASGDITFNGQVNATAAGAGGLSVDSNGDEVFNQLVGNVNRLASLSTDDVSGGTGSTRFNMDLTQAGAVAGVQVAGAVNVNDRAVFNAAPGAALPTILSGGTQTYALAATVRQGTVLTATGGNIVFSGTVDSGSAASALTVNASGDEVFNGLVGSLAPLVSLTTDNPAVLTPSGRVIFAAAGTSAMPSVTTVGAQTYNDPALLRADTVLTTSGGSILFAATVDSNATPFNLSTNTPTAGSTVTFAQTVGGAGPLASLTTNGNGTTRINGGITANPATVTTTGSQEYLQAVTLGSDTLLQAGGNVDFGNVASGHLASSLDGTHSLTVDAAAASFEAVGNNAPLVNLTVNAGGTTFNYVPALVSAGNAGVNLAGSLTLNSPAFFNAAGAGDVVFVRTGVPVAGVTATGAQDYLGAFTLAGNATFTDLSNGRIAFHQTVDGSGVANLTASTGGAVAFLGPVGAGTPLASLTTSNLGVAAGRTVLSGGGVTTVGAQTYDDAAFLGAPTVLTSNASGNVTLALTLDSLAAGTPEALTVNTSGATIFGGAVGSINALTSVTTDAPGSTQINGGGVTTTGAQTYNDAATLGLPTILASSAGGNVAFAKTLDSATAGTPEALTVNTSGATIFGGAVGATNALASVMTDAPGSTQINGGGVTTTGAQTYNDAVTLGLDTILTSTANGALTFNGTVDGAFALRLKTGGLTVFNQPVGNAAALTSLSTDSAGATQFNMPVGALAGVVVNGPVTINDPVSFAATGASLTQPTVLTIGNGVQTYAGAVTLATNTVLISAAALPGTAGAFTGGGAVAFNAAQGISSTGGNDLSVRAGVGTTTVDATISANMVDLGGAAVTFAGPVVLPGTVSVEPNGGVGGGNILFGGGTITTVGAQLYNVPFVLGGNTVLTSTGGGSITFSSTLDGAFALTLDSTGDEVLDGQVGGATPLASLTTDNPALIQPGGHVVFAFAGTTASPSITTIGAQTFNDAATLNADTVLASTGGSITFASTVDGARALTLNAAGDEVFDGRVGSTTPLASLTTDDAAGTISGGHVVFNVAGGSTTAVPGVTTTGAQTYNDPALLDTNTVLASQGGGTLTFNSTVDAAANGAQSLTLNSAGNEVFNGAVGGGAALASLVTDDPAANATGGSVIFNVASTGRSVTTVGAQTYNDAVTLLADTVLASTNNGAVTFVSTVDHAQALTISSGGLTTFDAAVGGSAPLASLTTRGGGAVALDGGTVNTIGLQSYGGVVTLGADTTLTSADAATGGITFAATVDSDAAATPRALTLNAAGNETFGGNVGGINALASLATDTNGARGQVIFGNATGAPATLGVTTLGAQTYNDAALLQTNTVLTSTSGGAVIFSSTVDGAARGAQALTVSTRSDVVFSGLVGNTTALATLTTSDPDGATAGGRVFFTATGTTAAPSVTTVGAQTYDDALVMQANTVLTSTQGGMLTFGATVDGTHDLGLNSSGDKIFDGRIGTPGAPLASLTIGADPAHNGGHVMFDFTGTADAPSVVTSGAQIFHDPVNLRDDTVLTSMGSGITFGATLDGAHALTLNAAGDVTFRGAVGSSGMLASLLTDAIGSGGRVVFDFAGSAATPSVQTTGAQTYGQVAVLDAPTFLMVAGNVTGPALTFESTIDAAAGLTPNPAALTLSTSGTTVLGGAIGSHAALASLDVAGSGPIMLNARSVTTDGSQDYQGAVTLQSASLTSNASAITFHSTVDGAGQSLTLTTPNVATNVNVATIFDGAVGTKGELSTLLATDGSAVVVRGGSVMTSGLQTYGGHVEISGADGGVVTTLAATSTTPGENGVPGNNLIFKANVDTDTGSLLVTGYRILAESNSNINVVNGGNLDLEASNTLILQGNTYGSDTGKVTLNDPLSGAVPNPATRASIYLTNQGRTEFKGSSFDMGYLQNMFSRGSIAIVVPGGTATLSDIAANGTLTVQAAQIDLRARNPDQARGGTRNGGTDDGLNFVARTAINFGDAPIRYLNSAASGNDIANFVTSTGEVTLNRDSAKDLSIFQDPTLATTFAQATNELDSDEANFGTFDTPFQLISGGTQTIDTAAALSGALPDQKPIDVASDITISASQQEELLKLGIHPRKAQKQERLSLASKRALFAQLVDGLDKDNYGRLQPIKGGISTLVPSDYVVVVDRMSEPEVQAILTAFEDLYGKNKEKVPPIGEAFNAAFNDYTTEKQTADPAGFAPYIAAKPGKYPDVDKAVRGFDSLFGYIEHLGLTDREQAKAKEHIASDLQVSGVSAEDMVKVIDTLRTKIPKAQKAPSTKLPPSAPAGNPAPNATSPGQPEQKKGTPPLKTARQPQPESTHQAARRTLPAADERAREVAGL